MTAKEKAKELVDRFLKEFPSTDDIGFGQIKIAKQCALICVDREIESLSLLCIGYAIEDIIQPLINELKEVKREIEEL